MTGGLKTSQEAAYPLRPSAGYLHGEQSQTELERALTVVQYYGTSLGKKPERVISAEPAVFAPNSVPWSECWDGKERRKQSGREKRGLVIVW